ncbi:MAG: 4-hydroxythreonine-4-phosphate dehydrogenase [Gammaproteobacteria bacterium]|nr:MAG: 4-hydroxythreonine-4-phosphate dehydrogenase [Gammaproteobacteria bacterium]
MNKIVITLGDPAGIGPDLGVLLAQKNLNKNIIIISDPTLLIDSASRLKKKIKLNILKNVESKTYSGEKIINVLPVKLNVKNNPGKLNPSNSEYVINTIKMAASLCLEKKVKCMVTGPISKSVLNDGGFKISGHTEFLAKICKSKSVMMLMNSYMKVALHTTHVPLKNVNRYITKSSLIETIQIINKDLKKKFKIDNPKILVTGLNPHAGEDGLLGNEDENIIKHVIKTMRKKHIKVDGPIPADTAFIKKNIKEYDIILTMYHDQGLPVIKFNNFKKTVNVTLGLPIIRVSVDHGTALDLVGTGKIDTSSFLEAIKVAKSISG